jgi:hypothetical protein
VKKLPSLSLVKSKPFFFISLCNTGHQLEKPCVATSDLTFTICSAVHLTGNYIPDEDMDQDPYDSDLMMGSSDEEDDLEEGSEDDEEEEEDDDM